MHAADSRVTLKPIHRAATSKKKVKKTPEKVKSLKTPKQERKTVEASNRHPTSSTTSSTATVQQQPSDPLSGVMATSKKQVEIQMYLSKFKIVGAAHAQESQSLQAGSHLARHRLHLRPAE
jgi:hypothetical protein